MGGCASVPLPIKFKKGGSNLPPEPDKEEAIPAAEEVKKAEQVEKKVEEEEVDRKEVVDETKVPSLGSLLDQDEKKSENELKKEELVTETTKAVDATNDEEPKAVEKKEEATK